MNDADAVRLENRLTRLEGLPQQISELGLSLSAQISQIDAKVTDTRRILDIHLTHDEKWMDEHNQKHAFAEGVSHGRALANKTMIAVLGLFITVVTVAANVLVPVIENVIGNK